MGIFSFLFKNKNKQKEALIEALKSKNSIIVDVRTAQEYSQAHIKGAINVPLNVIANEAAKFESKGKTVITCCKSGARSRSAADVLSSKGVNALNGGGWMSLNRIVEDLK